jgi:cell wall-associated NlpC family hydrolase
MNRRHWAHLAAAAVTLAAAALAAAAPAAAAASSGTSGGTVAGPAAAATAYLQARAAAITAADPAAMLAPYVVAGSTLACTEAKVAAGAALRGAAGGRTLDSAVCTVEVVDSRPTDGGVTTSVSAHAITTLTWRAANGKTDVEASGIDHTLSIVPSGDEWVVTADAYVDDTKAACLEAAGASRARVRAAARAVERAGRALAGRARHLRRATTARSAGAGRRYSDIVKYDRAAAQAFADDHALSYDPTFTHFDGVDCCNFASQCARAGDMLPAGGSVSSGWWYSKNGTSSPSDDTYSLSWINVGRQIGYWNGRRTDWETSAGMLSRGDFIYYDWSGDGVWDHVAVVAGTNSAGQKIIDAHTTDHYHVYWKLGSSGTKYRYAKVRAQWVVV